MYILIEEDQHGFDWSVKCCSRNFTAILDSIWWKYRSITPEQYQSLLNNKIVDNVVDSNGEYVRLMIEEIEEVF